MESCFLSPRELKKKEPRQRLILQALILPLRLVPARPTAACPTLRSCICKLRVGLVKTSAPVHGDIIVFAPGSCGASLATGHVAVIDVVDGATVTIVEQNNAGRRKCQASCAKYFLHVESNTGIPFSRNAANDADENHGIFIRISKNMVLIQLSGDFTSGASVRIFDFRGRQIADLTDRIQGGQTFFETSSRPLAPCIVSVRKGSWGACKRILKP